MRILFASAARYLGMPLALAVRRMTDVFLGLLRLLPIFVRGSGAPDAFGVGVLLGHG
jgi:hypothetical protein